MLAPGRSLGLGHSSLLGAGCKFNEREMSPLAPGRNYVLPALPQSKLQR